MIDIHAHFAEEGYEFPSEWERIGAAGVNKVVLAGDNLAHSTWHRDFCASHEGAYFCAGVHPSFAAAFEEEQITALRRLAAEEKCVAVGEIGLDYHYPDTDKAAQREAFIAQILLAEGAGLPVQIHSRDAYADTLALLTELHAHLRYGFLLHCYSYGVEGMDAFLRLGGYFSFGGVVCFKNAKKAVECVKHCPRERLLTETDSPYLSPFRGEKNSPANLPVIVEKIASVREEEKGELIETIRKNAERLFPRLKGGKA